MKTINYVKKHVGNMVNKLEAAATMLKVKLCGNCGDSNLASVIFLVVVVIVVITVIFFPQLRSMVEGVFDKSNEKLNSIWNYS